MALSSTQIASFLFKVLQGKSSSDTTKQFFEEPYNGRAFVLPSQVWAQAGSIPNTAPGGTNLQITGVVKRYIDLTLTAIAGVSNAFYDAALVDCIPFNFGDGSYNYALKDSTGTSIPFGTNDWIVDPNTGVVTFYNGVPGNMPPKISFYRYVGTKGVATDTIAETQVALTSGGGYQNITGLLLDGTSYKLAMIEYNIYRTTSLEERLQSGLLIAQYFVNSTTWLITPAWQANDALVVLDVAAGGQMQANPSALTGTGDSTTLTYRLRTLK